MPALAHSREVRLGIVMYGGVSLAVYENGVANELYRAVKGRGFYELIKNLIDSDIVVDIISGTSAGGINGVLLAYALVNGRDFASSAKLWRDKGDLLELLRKPSDPNHLSVLNSEGYYEPELAKAFANLEPEANPQPLATELDVFVTGTDVHGRVYTAFDDKGDPIDVKDHRCVFNLSYRGDRKNHFSPDNVAALAKLCRITSCFPVAFAPVHVAAPNSADNPDEEDRDSRLRTWGNLPHDAYFLDGGLLDNKPFSYTIDAIFGRMADREVDRMLFYVEPDPERFRDEKLPAPPNVAQAAIEALIGIPGYESIAGDLRSISDHNNRVLRYRELRSSVLPELMQLNVRDVVDEESYDEFKLLPNDSSRTNLYLEARLASLRDRAIAGMLKDNGALPLRRTVEDRRSARVLVDSFAGWKGSGVSTLAEFDIYYRIRRAYDAVYAIYDGLYRNAPAPATAADYMEAWRRLNHQLQVYEIIRYAMERAIDMADFSIAELAAENPDPTIANRRWEAVQNILRYLLDETDSALPTAVNHNFVGWSLQDRLREEEKQRRAFYAKLKARLEFLERPDREGVPAPRGANILSLTDIQERRIFRPISGGDSVRRAYCRFILTDSYLFPIAHVAEIDSIDILKTVRISPIDGKHGIKPGQIEGKLCGRQLGHFGGFLKSSWRANDILAGRLDAICQLVECLVTKERLAKLSGRSAVARLTDPDAVLTADEQLDRLRKMIAATFPNSPPPDQARLVRDIADLGSPQADFDAFLDHLVTAAQREMLEEEVPNVLSAAITQQAAWNQYRIEPSGDLRFVPATQSWRVGTATIDSTVLNYAQQQYLRDATRAEPGHWSHLYIHGDYAVGAEVFSDDVPKTVLLEMISTAALVLGNCLTGVVGEKRAEKIRQNPAFKFVVEFPLRALNAFSRSQRTGREYSETIAFAVLAVCLAVLGVALYAHDPLLASGSAYNFQNIALFVVVPLLGILTICYLWSLMRLVTFALSAGAVLVAFLQLSRRVQFLWDYRVAIWVGAVTAMFFTVPARQLWGNIVDIASAFARLVSRAFQWMGNRLSPPPPPPAVPRKARDFMIDVTREEVKK